MTDEGEGDSEYFRERGFDVALSNRDLHAEHLAQGEPGRASYFRAGQNYVCVDLLRNGVVVASNYASGETAEAALVAARRRYGSEQE